MNILEKFQITEGLSETIFQTKYAIHPNESWEEASNRLATHVAKAEPDNIRQGIVEEFNEEIVTNRFMPGGRIWYGSGRPRAQLLNCFVLPTSDSREGWGKTLSDVIVVSGMGGGVGVNCSPIRPRNSPIRGTGGFATGAVSLMNMINGIGDELVSGGARRIALMLDLNITHPDMPEFVEAKLDKNKLNNANVSVIIDKRMNADKFVDTVKAGKNFDLTWGGTHYGTQNAKALWEKIVTNAWSSGEPGVLNGDLANRESNISYLKPLVSTNPCGEIWLEEYGCCDLGALVLPRFINAFGSVDWNQLRLTIRTAVRFLDNVLSVNEYPLPEIRDNCNNLRRIGLGIMGLHDLLISLGYKYSSREAKDFVDQLMNFIKIEAYQASIDLAIEKGPFPAYQEEFIQSGFVQRAIPTFLQEKIKNHGIRNCALLTIAPTGTTGMVANVSTGIEPIFSAAYYRRFNRPNGDGTIERAKELVINPWWKKLESQGKSTRVLEGAYDISPFEHFEMQRICQRHIDNATSKTINLPNNYSVDSLGDLWLEYLPDLKGTTLYRAGSRGEEPLEVIPLDVAINSLNSTFNNAQLAEGAVTEQNSMDCPDGVCEIPENLRPKIEDRKEVIQFI